MRNIDLQCQQCGHIIIDHFQRTREEALPACEAQIEGAFVCGGVNERVYLPTKRNTVISDECDIVVHNGICWPDGTPRRYRFKSEMRAQAAKQGLQAHVEHKGTKGSDHSPHTSRWI